MLLRNLNNNLQAKLVYGNKVIKTVLCNYNCYIYTTELQFSARGPTSPSSYCLSLLKSISYKLWNEGDPKAELFANTKLAN